MRDIHLDLLHRKRPLPRLSWLLLAIGSAVFVSALILNVVSQSMLERAESARGSIPSARSDKGASQASKAGVRNVAIDPPWEKLLSRLEQTKPKDIALLQLEADGLAGTAVLIAQASSHDSMLAYLGKLNVEPGLQNVALSQHVETDNASSRGIRFTIRLNWKQR